MKKWGEEYKMNLTFEQIKAVTVGAIRIEQCEDGIPFFKCTQKQIDAFTLESATLGTRAKTTTGVRLDFYTNSKEATFEVVSGGKYEVYINGLLRAQYDTSENKRISLRLCDPLGHAYAEDARVTLYFPAHSIGVLKSVELDDGATIAPHKFDNKFLFIGDSITQGWAANYDSLSYAQRVSRFYNAESVIQGIGGAYFHELTFDSIDFDPDVVFVAYGTNDFGHYKTYAELEAHADAHLSLIAKEYANKKRFYISPIWRDKRDGKSMGTFEGCREILTKLAADKGFTVIDGLMLVPPVPELFMDEYLHPNDNGFSLYAENLISVLQKYL